ncbi:hypothetical protein BCON_0138g00220 [Botryotinia convoluta]|uniref:Uncharacterized protein n=1 Tax=Botryotinia convoluta TaxID=54673 RepID=A0A4Z1HUH0_9HELO|nr:hypothetical protein BCON_0138g00220 [Botryotinia convoluta]
MSSPYLMVVERLSPDKPNALSYAGHIVPTSGSAPIEGIETNKCYLLTPSESCCKSLDPLNLLLMFCPLPMVSKN